MGYKLTPRTATIVFDEGTDFAGLEVRVNLRVPMGRWFDQARLFGLSKNPEAMTEAMANGTIEAGFREFCEQSLIGWNLEDEDGNPVPADYEHFRQQDMLLIQTIIGKWTETASTPSAPLEKPSSNTPPPGLSMQTVPLE